MIYLPFKFLTEQAQLPRYATPDAACFDLYAAADVEVPACGGVATVPTGIAFAIPSGWCLKIYARSGAAFKKQISLVNSVGIIDADYRGEVLVGLRNDSPERYHIKTGDRIAQAMLERADRVVFDECDVLHATERGAAGFGSTGR